MACAYLAEHRAFPSLQKVPFDSTTLDNECCVSQTSFVLNVWVPVEVWNNPVITSLCCDTELFATKWNGFLYWDAQPSTVFKFLVSCLRVDYHLYVKLVSEITSPSFSWLLLICSSPDNQTDELCTAAGCDAGQWGWVRWDWGRRARPVGT